MNSNKNSYLNCTGKSAQTDSKSILDVLTGMNYGEFFEKLQLFLFECFFENDFFLLTISWKSVTVYSPIVTGTSILAWHVLFRTV